MNTLEAPRIKEALALFLGFGLFYFLFLGGHPLFLPDEARYSEVAREMLVSHDFITPRLNGSVFFHKPILFYWLQSLSLSLFGLSPWAIRFFPAVLGVLGLVFCYWSSALLWGRKVALLAAIILGTTPLYYGGAHYANMDLEVAVWVNASLLSLLVGVIQEKKTWVLSAYLFGALAFLTKGLIGFAFPAAIMGLWILATGQWKYVKRLHLFWGLIIFLALSLPWLIAVSLKNPDFLHFFFYNQQLQRFATQGFNNKEPFYFYLLVSALGFLPWSLFLARLKSKIWPLAENKLELYLILWALVVLVFFSLPSSKLVGYIIPIFAPLAILTALIIDRSLELKIYYRSLSVLFALLGICSAFLGLNHFSFLNPLYVYRADFILGAIIAFIAAGLLWRNAKAPGLKAFYLLASLWAVLCGMTAHGIQHINTRAVTPLLQAVPLNAYTDLIAYNAYYYDLPLAAQNRIRVVLPDWTKIKGDDWRTEIGYALSQDPQQKQRLINENEFWKLWFSTQRYYVFVPKHHLSEFLQKAGAVKILGKTDRVVLLTQGS